MSYKQSKLIIIFYLILHTQPFVDIKHRIPKHMSVTANEDQCPQAKPRDLQVRPLPYRDKSEREEMMEEKNKKIKNSTI